MIAALYALATVLIISTLLDTVVRVWPLHFGNRDWRFGAFGIFLSSPVTLLLGVALAMGAGFVARSTGAIRAFSYLALAAAVVLTLSLMAFVVDFTAMAPSVDAALKTTFRVAALKAVALTVLTIPAAAALGWGGVRSLQGDGSDSGAQSEDRGSLVVGQPS